MSCQSCNWKQLWEFEKNFPWIDEQVQSASEFLHDVVVCCCLLHNMIMSRKHMNIDELMLATFKDGKDIRNSYTWWKGNDSDVKPILQVGDILGVNQWNAI